MVENNPPGYMQARTDHPAVLMRRGLMGLMDGAASGATNPAGGVHPGYGNRMTCVGSASAMQVTVDTGIAYVPASTAWSGSYVCFNDALVTLNVAASNATLYRRDLIVAQVLDTTAGDGSDLWQLAIIQGTNNASSPAPLPTQPNRTLLLGIINVDPAITNLTGKVTNSQTYVAGIGALRTTTTSRPAAPRTGLITADTDANKQVSYYDGTAYRFVSDAGWQTWTPASQNHGSATFTTQQGMYKMIAEKTLAFHIQITINAAGSGSSAWGLQLPFNVDRSQNQIVLGYKVASGSSTETIGTINFWTSGSGGWSDRIRFPSTWNGSNLLAGDVYEFQGFARLA